MTPTVLSATTMLDLVEWQFRQLGVATGMVPVRLPHDAMLTAGRDRSSAGGADAGWFLGGDYEYVTTFQLASADRNKRVVLFFEGVQGDAEVLVNDVSAGHIRSGYTEAELEVSDLLHADRPNAIRVLVSHSAQPAERWYPGSGLYRRVLIIASPAVRFKRDGVRFRTRTLTAERATVEIEVDVDGDLDGESISVVAKLRRDGVVAAEGSATPGAGPIALTVLAPRGWSADDPFLYDLEVQALRGEEVVAHRSDRVGLRVVSVDPRAGLQVNGRQVLLRGACIHHDNGLLGAATHRAAEFRRIRTLKAAGFNAIRSAHNPVSRHLLDACDELGMYVLDEFADYWYVRKTAHDHSDRFLARWREDADALIAKDRNRPSVVMYAIGNEIPETATADGVALARTIADYFHRADSDRPTTVAVNLFLNALVSLNASPYKARPAGEQSMAGSTEANVMVNHIGRMMSVVARLPIADKASRDAFGSVDVAGYNYGLARYRGDVRRYPTRVILGTETLPGDVARAWSAVKKHPAVIGDFVWAGWEYLGEAGVATWVPGKRAGLSKPYPHVAAGPGMFDLTGRADASLRLAQAAWGLLPEPAITVRPLDRSGIPYVRSAWRVTDAVESWSWQGSEGKPAQVEVYSADEEVELLLNGRTLGRRRAGERRGFLARFKVPYAPGTLTAIGYVGGRETARSSLTSAGPDLALHLAAEERVLNADGNDLLHIEIALQDGDGQTEMLVEDRVHVTVTGPAELIATGSANPAPEASFLAPATRTYRGRALAILRSTGTEGEITVSVRSDAHGAATISVPAVTAESAAARDVNTPTR